MGLKTTRWRGLVPLLGVALLTLLAGCAGSGAQAQAADAMQTRLQGMQALDGAAYDTPPRVVRTVPIAYPGVRQQKRESGHAEMAFTITAEGRARDFSVISASNPAFAGYVIIKLRQWVFSPALKDGKPVPARFSQRFVWELGRGDSAKSERRRPAAQRDDDAPRVIDIDD